MLLVHARTHEVDDSNVVARLASRAESVAELEPQQSFEHCFVGLLKTSSELLNRKWLAAVFR